MKKLLIPLAFFLFTMPAFAADLTFDADTELTLTGLGFTLYAKSGAEATSLTNDETTLTVEVPAGSTFSLGTSTSTIFALAPTDGSATLTLVVGDFTSETITTFIETGSSDSMTIAHTMTAGSASQAYTITYGSSTTTGTSDSSSDLSFSNALTTASTSYSFAETTATASSSSSSGTSTFISVASNTPRVVETTTEPEEVETTTEESTTDSEEVETTTEETIPEKCYFTDIENHWSEDIVIDLCNKEIIGEEEDNLFKPDENINQRDLSEMLETAFNIEINSYYKNDLYITRGRAIHDIYRFLGVDTETRYDAGFPDIDKDTTYKEDINYAVQNGLIIGYENKNFGINDTLKKGQIAKIIQLLM